MKKTLLALVACLGLLCASCATNYPVGVAYTSLRLPVAVGPETGDAMKLGIAQSRSIFGLIATGDSSVEAACDVGKITRIHHVDWEVESFFGIYSVYKTRVYGN